MSETIEILEHLRDNNLANLEMGCYEDGDIERTIIEENKALNTAISALRSQSEAERKIKIVIEMCNSCLESIVRYKIYTSDEMGDLARDIIETLEEKE